MPPRRTPAGDALSEVAVLALRLGALLGSVGDELARPAGQTSARWQVLAVVEHAPAPVADVARALRLARQSVQRIADVLVADGLAAYVDNPEHQRAKLLHLTPGGLAALRDIQAAQAVWADALGASLGEGELRRTRRALARLLEAIEAQRTGGP